MIMNEMIKNYKTTICGVVLIVTGLFGYSQKIMSATEASALIMAGAGFITSKDA